MGLEISQKTALNQYEIINHKTNISLWLHDVVDGLIVPGRVTIENLIAGVTLGLDELYSASDHDHDEDYAALAHNHDSAYSALTHNHDSDYADIDHNHDSDYAALTHDHDSDYATLTEAAKHLKFSRAEWAGNATTNTQRTINLTGDVTYTKFLMVMAWETATSVLPLLGFWATGYGTAACHFRWGTGGTSYYESIADVFYTAPNSTSGAIVLYNPIWNYSGLSYKGFFLGVS